MPRLATTTTASSFPTLVSQLQHLETVGPNYTDLRFSKTLDEVMLQAKIDGTKAAATSTRRRSKKPKEYSKPLFNIATNTGTNTGDDESTVNLKKYLTNPSVVDDLLRQAMAGSGPPTTITTATHKSPQTSPNSVKSEHNADANTTTTTTADKPKQGYVAAQGYVDAKTGRVSKHPPMKLPLIRCVSPQLQRQLKRLPAANAKESKRMGEIEKDMKEKAQADFFKYGVVDKKNEPGGLYGNITKTNYSQYKTNATGAEVSDRKLLKTLLVGDLEQLLKDPDSVNKINKLKSGKTNSKTPTKKKKDKQQPPAPAPPTFRPAPLYDSTITTSNPATLSSLSSFYSASLVHSLEAQRLAHLNAISTALKSHEQTHALATSSNITNLRQQLTQSQTRIDESNGVAAKAVHDAKYAGAVPDDLIPANQLNQLKFEKGVKILRKYYLSKLRCEKKVFLAQWRSQTKIKYSQQLEAGARMVQRCYYKHLARVELGERMKQRAIQKAREDEIIRLYNEKLRKAAEAIQSRWRSRLAYRKLVRKRLELESAETVTRSYRCYKARLVLTHRRAVFAHRNACATKVQNTFRAFKGRQYVRILKKIKTSARIERKQQEEKDKRKQFFEDQGAAVLIQYAWRRRQLWLNLRYFMDAQRKLKAVRLQQGYRLFKAKREVKKRRAAKLALETLHWNSAILVQTKTRQFFAKGFVDKIRFNIEKKAYIRRLEKVQALRPRIWETPFYGPRKYELDKKGIPKRDADDKKKRLKDENGQEIEPKLIEVDIKKVRRDLIDAGRYVNPYTYSRERRSAILAQTLYRGHRARARVKWKRQREKIELQAWMETRQLATAIRIQACFRGHVGRKYAELLLHTMQCVFIQKMFRGFTDRKFAATILRQYTAAACIQKQQRGYVRRVEYNHYISMYKKQLEPARAIQRTTRSYIARLTMRDARHRARDRAEKAVIARANETFCRKQARLNLLLDSVWHPRGLKHDGLFQDIFKHWGHDGKIENSHFTKLFKDAPSIIGTKYESPDTGKQVPFTVTDLDLMFTHKKEKGVKHLTFKQFVELIEVINATLFGHIKDKEGHRGKKARMLHVILEQFFKSKPIGVGFRKNLDERSVKYVNWKATRLQAICRGFHYRLMYRMKREEKERRDKREREERKVLFIQVLARKYISRVTVIKMAERIYVKYVDPSTDEPYWSNPRTKRVSWVKPKIFGKTSDVSHPTILPHKGTEFLVMCVNCGDQACALVCNNCDDAFCKTCFDALHTKGTRVNHKPNAIPTCRECDYQLSTKTCETCTAETHKSCNYCDVCHLNVHRYDGEKDKKHNWSWLVQCCVECRSYAARWRCEDCQDVYCTGCFSNVHKRGTRVNHKCEPLTYYTPTIHDHYEREMREKNRRDRKGKDLEEEAERLRKLEYRSACVVQKRYRGNRGRKVGKAHLKEGRQKIRAAWRQRKEDDKIRTTKWYVAMEPLGKAPRLKSDSLEEAVLKTLPIVMRPRALYWINQNLQDDYWFPERIIGKKKIPKRGFAVGRYSELCEQALWGGVRLPGRHGIKQGKLDVDTPTESLDKLLEFFDRVRVTNCIYTVDKDAPKDGKVIPIDRAWRFADKQDFVMYKYPPQHLYVAKARKFVYSVLQSQIFQMQLRLILKGGDIMEVLLTILNRVVKAKLSMKSANKLKRFIDGFNASKKRTKYFDRNRQNRMLADDMDALDNIGAGASAAEPTDEEKEAARIAAMLEDNDNPWEERVDEKTLKPIWVHKETGEIRQDKPDASEEKEAAAEQQRTFEESQKRLQKMRKGGRNELGKKRK